MQFASSKQQTKQKYKPNHQQTGLPPHSALPIRGKTNKQTNKHSAQISPYKKLTQTTGPNLEGRNQKEERIQPASRKNSTFLNPQTQSLQTKQNKKILKGREILHK